MSRIDLDAHHCIDVLRGRRKLHTFALTPTERQLDDGTRLHQWVIATPLNHQQARDYDARHQAALCNAERQRPELLPLIQEARPPLRRPAGEMRYGQPLDSTRVDLGEGVRPRGSWLAVVLFALQQAGRTEVNLHDLKVVMSQLGSAIKALFGACDDAEQRGKALAALSTEIVRRCTRV